MKDKLIGLIKGSSEYICDSAALIERLADHLLANGVIVPPFAAGETVWCLEREDGEYVGIVGEMFIAVVGNAVITSAFLHDFGNDIDEALEYYIKETEANFEVDVSFFSLNDCFGTKEEAEKALAEREARNERNGN